VYKEKKGLLVSKHFRKPTDKATYSLLRLRHRCAIAQTGFEAERRKKERQVSHLGIGR